MIDMKISYHLNQMRRFLEEFRGRSIVYFPNPGNAGDSLIAAGTYQALQRAGVKISIYSPGMDVRNQTVFVGGGGNLVPLYREARETLEAILPSAARIVVLPHTVRGNEDLLKRLDARVTVFCRDPVSYWHVLQCTHADVRLDHDMAFHLDIESFNEKCLDYHEMPRVFASRVMNIPVLLKKDVGPLFFMREDGERKAGRADCKNTLDLSTAFEFGVVPDTAEKSVWCMFQAVSSATHVTTDRLHVGISCAILGKSCTLLDNSYGKNRGIYLHSIRRFTNKISLGSEDLIAEDS
jgi:exopolysaccharide biosynthesis predicted pyruvyltransferase EpsI